MEEGREMLRVWEGRRVYELFYVVCLEVLVL